MQRITRRKEIGVSAAYTKDVLSFYKLPPTDNVTLEEFELFAFDRLRVLKEIEACHIRGLQRTQLNNRLKEMCSKYLPLSKPEDVRKDVISHFVLRLAFCRPSDRSWFLQQELALLKYRLTDGGYIKMSDFLRNTGTIYDTLSQEEYDSIQTQLETTLEVDQRGHPEQIFKVPFEDAGDLVGRRQVYLSKGTAFVHQRAFVSIVLSRYRLHLADSLAKAFKARPNLNASHSQLTPLLSALPKAGMPSDFRATATAGQVSLATLSVVAQRSFPPCMSAMRRALTNDHKLKHWGRLQYGLFLKAIGLSLDEALIMWRQEFTKIMSDKDFESGYAYNVRHMYGKVGKRTDYSPYSCHKIITGQLPSSEDTHGCPFRHASANQLRASLTNDLQRVAAASGKPSTSTSSAVSELLGLVTNKHYQIACKRHFELTHPSDDTSVRNDELTIHHPNQYFDESEKYFEAQNKK